MKHRVIIRRCDEYDPDKIRGIVKEGMEELGVRPSGRVLLKPNVVIAHPEMFPNAFTRKEFLEGVISATRDQAQGVEELAVGERSGLTLATRWAFKNAGYPEVLKRQNVKAHYFDEVQQVPVELKKEGRLRDLIFIPKPVTDCDFLINLPKFKAHPWCRLTLSLKNFIGIQDDRHRLVDHNIFLEQKIADLQEVIQPHFIAIDGIIAGQKMMLTPTPFPLGAIVMGTNSCAVDTVGCHMVHVDPKDVVHLRLASGRGFGPMSLDEIEISGDFPLDEVQARTGDFEFCLERIDDYFGQESNISCTVGTFPEDHSPDYCWGGCPGALQEAVHIFRAVNSNVEKDIGKIRVVIGKVEEPLDLAEGERVLFAGNCTSWQGEIDGQEVSIDSSYRTTHEVDATKTKSNDMLLKNLATMKDCLKNRNSPYMHAKGCTVSVPDFVHYLSSMGKVGNPNFDPRIAVPANVGYWQMRFNRFKSRFQG